MKGRNISVVSGLSSSEFSYKIADLIGASVCNVDLSYFDDGELNLSFKERLTDQDVIVVQGFSVVSSDCILSLFFLLDAISSLAVRSVRLVLSYLPYSRSDRSVNDSSVVSIRSMARLLKAFKLDGIYTVDVHSILGSDFFSGALTQLSTCVLWKNCFYKGEISCVISPDRGGLERARHLAKALDCQVLAMQKNRSSDPLITFESLPNCLKGAQVLIIDDLMVSCDTILSCAQILLSKGFKVSVCVTHVFAKRERLLSFRSMGVSRVIITDSIFNDDIPDWIEVVSLAPLLVERLCHDMLT